MSGPTGLTYEEVLNLYKGTRSVPEFKDMDLPAFSRRFNQDTGTQLFSAGEQDSKLKRASVGIDEALRATHLPEALGEVGGSLGKLISPDLEETGRHFGEGFPRATVDAGLTLGGLALTPELPMVGLPLLGLGAGSTFAKGYTDTGSKAVGAISAAATLLAPTFGKLGARYLTGPISKSLGASTELTHIYGVPVELPASTGSQLGGRLVDLVGHNIGFAVDNELARQASSVALGEGLQNPFTAENVFQQTLGVLPFFPQGVMDAIKGPGKGKFQSVGEQLRAEENWSMSREFQTAEAQRQKLAREVLTEFHGELRKYHSTRSAESDRPTGEGDYTPSPATTVNPDMMSETQLRGFELEHERRASSRELERQLGVQERLNQFNTLMGKPIELAPEPVNALVLADKLSSRPKDVASVEQVGKLVNQLQQEVRSKWDVAFLDSEQITDTLLGEKMREFLADGNEAQAYDRATNWLYKKLADAAKHRTEAEVNPPTLREARVEDAVVELGQYPEDTVNWIVSKIQRIEQNQTDQGFDSGPFYKAALNVLKANPDKPFAEIQAELNRVLTGTKKFAQREFAGDRAEAGLTSMEDPETARLAELTPSSQEAVLEQHREADADSRTASLLGPVTAEEAPNLTPQELAYVSEVIRQLGSGDIRPGTKGNKRIFTFTENGLAELAKAGGVTPKVARNYFTKYRKTWMEIVAKRKGIDLSADNDFMAAFHDYDGTTEPQPYVKPQVNAIIPADLTFPRNALPLGAKRFFYDFGRAKGMTDAEAHGFAEAAQATASVFPHVDNARLAMIIQDPRSGVLGIAAQFGQAKNVVGLDPDKSFFGFVLDKISEPSREMLQFMKLYALSHEVYHTYSRLYRDQLENPSLQTLSPERKARMDKIYGWADKLASEDKRDIIKSYLDVMIPQKLRDNFGFADNLQELERYGTVSTEEFLATISGIIGLGVARPSKITANTAKQLMDEVMYSPKYLNDFINMHFADVSNMSDAMVDLAKTMTGKETQNAELIRNFNTEIRGMLKNQSEVAMTVEHLRYLESTRTENYLDATSPFYNPPIGVESPAFKQSAFLTSFMKRQFPDKEMRGVASDFLRTVGIEPVTAREARTLKDYLGVQPNWYERWMLPIAQFRELYPMVKDITDLAFVFRSIASTHATEALKPLMTRQAGTGKLVFDENHAGITRIATDPKMRRVFDWVRLEQNERKGIQLDEGEIREFGKVEGLSDADTDLLIQTSRGYDVAMQHMAKVTVIYAAKMLASTPIRMLVLDARKFSQVKAPIKDLIAMGEQFTDAYLKQLSNNPEVQMQGDQIMAQLQARLPAETAQKMADSLKEQLPAFQKVVQTFTERPGYSPEVRLGEYYVRYKNAQNKTVFLGFETREGAEARLKKIQGDTTINPDTIKIFTKTDKLGEVNQISGDAPRVMAELENEVFNRIIAASGEQDTDVAKLYTPGGTVWKEVTARTFRKYGLQRKSVEGREEIDMQKGLLSYITGVSLGLAKTYTRDRASIHMMSDDMVANPKVKKLMSDYLQTVIDPPAREWSTFKNVIFQFVMGANPSSIIVEAAQPVFSLAPWFVRQGVGFAGSFKLIGKAMDQLGYTAFAPKRDLPELYQLPTGKEGKTESVLERAQREGRVDFGVFQELAQQEDVIAHTARRLASGDLGTVENAASYITKPLIQYANWTRNLYTKASSFNVQVALIAGYLHGIEKGWTREEAYNFGVRTSEATMFGGGSAARPIGLFANKGNMFGAVGAWYTLKHYTGSMIGTMYRLSKESLGKADLPDDVRKNAQKALAQMVGTQLLMSGALGLPMSAGALALLEQLFPDLEAKKGLRAKLGSLFGEDDATGAPVTDAFLNGLPSMLGSVDVTQRFGLGDIFGIIDPQSGLDPGAVFGAGGSVIANLGRAVGEVSRGEFGKAVQFAAPNSFKGITTLYNNDFQVRDAGGNLLFEPSAPETLMAAIGFRPKRLAEYREQQHMLQRSSEIEARQTRDFHSRLAEQLLQGDTEGVRIALLTKARESEFYDPRAGLRAVVELAQGRTVPADPNLRGSRTNVSERESLTRTYQAVTRPSEVALLTQRKLMEKKVGLPGAGQMSPTEMTVAQAADRLLQSNPTLSRQHALLLARQLAAKSPYGRGVYGGQNPAMQTPSPSGPGL